jgi:hypothetical protein
MSLASAGSWREEVPSFGRRAMCPFNRVDLWKRLPLGPSSDDIRRFAASHLERVEGRGRRSHPG